MEIYDTANKLASEIKASNEYKNYKKAKENLQLSPDKNMQVKDFNKLRYEQQMEVIQTGKQNEEKLKDLEKKYVKLIKDEQIKEYIEAETKFNLLIQDVNKIIGDAIKDLVL